MVSMKVFKIISKSLRLIVRSRTSVAAVLLGPLLIITLVGLAFGNSSQYSLTIGVYSDEYTELVNSYLDKLGDDNTFKIVKYPLVDLCVNDIKRGSTHTCVAFPDGFELGVEGANKISFYVDQSKADILAIVRTVVISQLSERTAEIASDQTADVLEKIEDVNLILEEELVVLNEISDLHDSTRKKLSDIVDTVSSLEDGLGNSGEDMEDIDSKASQLFALTEDIADEGYDALDEGDFVNTNISDAIEENIDELLNQSATINDELTNLVADYVTKNNDFDDFTRDLDNDASDASAQLSDAISKLTGVRTAFAAATGNFAGLDIGDAENLTAPIKTAIEPVVAEQAPLSYMFPTLLVMVIMLVSTMLAGTLVVMEKTSNSYFRNFVTPTADIVFISGIFLTNIVVTLAQTVLILLVSSVVFGGAVLSNFITIFVSLSIIAALFTLIGMILGYLFNSQEMVALSGITVSSLFILLSGILVPLEQMPSYMLALSKFNPLLLGESILRKAIVFQTPILNEVIMRDIFLLIAFTIVAFLLVIVVQHVKKEIYLTGTLLKKKRFGDEAVEGEGTSTKKKKSRTLDFLEDFTGTEVEETKKSKNPFTKLIRAVRPKPKAEQVIFSGDEEMDPKQREKLQEQEEKNEAQAEEEPEEKGSAKKVAKGSAKKTSSKSGKDDFNPLLVQKLEPHQYFVLSSGNIIKSFPELVDELKTMDSETFSYHVGDDKNDFYLWIKNVLNAEKPAEKIKGLKDGKKMAKALRKFI
jgi:ABC-type multidrug transport system permease subunit